jgi:Zn-dependent protease
LFVVINIGLAVFNMLPIPPLDGSKFLFHYVIHGRPHLYPIWEFLERFGFILLYAVILIPATSGLLGFLIRGAAELLGKLYGLAL